MMNIESALWKVVSYNEAYAYITQKASNTTRAIAVNKLPSVESLANMNELRFNRVLRELFHSAARY